MSQLSFIDAAPVGRRETYRVIRIVGGVLARSAHFTSADVEDYSDEGTEFNLHEAIRLANATTLETGCPCWVLAEALDDLVAYRVSPDEFNTAPAVGTDGVTRLSRISA